MFWPAINLMIVLYGILIKGWNLQPVIFIFWIQVMLIVAMALIRVATAMDGQPFLATLGQKILLLFFGGVLGAAFIMLTVTFTFRVFEGGFRVQGFQNISTQSRLLIASCAIALLLNYFLNGRFRLASPAEELGRAFIYLLILTVWIMAITQFVVPRFAGAAASLWTGLAVVVVKFVVDWLAWEMRGNLSWRARSAR